MSPLIVSCIVFACTFAGALIGTVLQRVVPEHHISEESKDTVKLAMSLVGTMAALVLALLIASANSYHDLQSTQVTELSSDFILLDRTLARYGAEAKDARSQVPITVRNVLAQTWSEDAFRSDNLDRAFGPSAEMFYSDLKQLEPRTAFQRVLYAQLLEIGLQLGRKRSLLLEQAADSISTPFLVVLVFWLGLIFFSLGLFAPTNVTVAGMLLACAFSVATAIFLILALDHPFQGFMEISSAPLRNALLHLGR